MEIKDLTLTSGTFVTERPFYRITHLLTLDDVKERIATKEKYQSAPFSEENDQTKFRIELEFDVEGGNWLSVYLKALNRSVLVNRYTLTILDINLKKLRSCSFTDWTFGEGLGWGVAKFFPLSDFSLPDDTICLRTEINFADDTSSGATRQLSSRDASFDNDLRKLCADDANADVTIIVAERKFKAHKSLLAGRSEYFRCLFASGMLESRKNEVEIDEVDPEVFQNFLEFIYTGLPPASLLQVAWDLLPLADRYGATTLKDKCEGAIVSLVSSTNCIEALMLAHAHCCTSLLDVALKVIRKNQRALHATAEWKELKKNRELLALVVESYAE